MSTPQYNFSDDNGESTDESRPLRRQRPPRTLIAAAILIACAVFVSCTVERSAESSSPRPKPSNVEEIDTSSDDDVNADDCPFSSLHAGASPNGEAFETPEAVAAPDGELVIPVVEPVTNSEIDFDLISFDDTRIRLHWFPHPDATASDPMPTVLMGPGWSLAGDTTEAGLGLFGGVNIAALRDAGFNVLTWDPRGFGDSEGSAQVNSVEYEARDVQLTLNWLGTLAEVQLDRPGDPRIGMVGVSYGGGIQLAVASQDCRVDALVPSLAWNSLPRSLYQSELMKAGWAGVLVNTAITGSIDEHIQDSYREGRVSGVLSDENSTWFASRGPGHLVEKVTAPTLLIQGTTDTLFTLNEGLVNFELLHQAGTPVAMLWFCGGHGFCLTNEDDEQRISDATISWLDHYLNDNESSAIDWVVNIVDQHGNSYASTSPESVISSMGPLSATWQEPGGELTLQRNGGSGPTKLQPPSVDIMYALVQSITPAPAENAVEVALSMDGLPGAEFDEGDTLLLGVPKLTIDYRGSAEQPSTDSNGTERPTHVFAQLVDMESGIVVGNQVTPVPLILDGTDRQITLELEAIAHLVGPLDTLTLQLVSNTVAYADPQHTGMVEFTNVELAIPVAEGFIRQ